MKILCVTQDFPPLNLFGVCMFSYNLCIQLNNNGHQVDVLAPFHEKCEDFDSLQPFRIYRYANLPLMSSLPPILRVILLHVQHKYDVVFIPHFRNTHLLGVLLMHKLKKIPYMILSHGNDMKYRHYRKINRVIASWLLNNASMMLANSRYTRELIRQAHNGGQVEVLTPGVDTRLFHPGVNGSETRQKYNLNSRRVLLTVANLVPKKNIDRVLCALPAVIEKVPEALYLIVGNGIERKRLSNLCDKLNLNNYVRFLGLIDNRELPELYRVADLYVMPSYEADCGGGIETFGIVFIEAGACGLPVIGGKSGGIRDAVSDRESGILVDPHDVDAIAGAIVTLLNDRELSHRLGEYGRQRVENEFSWEKIGKRLEGFLEQVVDR